LSNAQGSIFIVKEKEACARKKNIDGGPHRSNERNSDLQQTRVFVDYVLALRS
jgi:hypothetical protein